MFSAPAREAQEQGATTRPPLKFAPHKAGRGRGAGRGVAAGGRGGHGGRGRGRGSGEAAGGPGGGRGGRGPKKVGGRGGANNGVAARSKVIAKPPPPQSRYKLDTANACLQRLCKPALPKSERAKSAKLQKLYEREFVHK